jgi:hypothetical protein
MTCRALLDGPIGLEINVKSSTRCARDLCIPTTLYTTSYGRWKTALRARTTVTTKLSSQMYADNIQERYSQMGMSVPGTVMAHHPVRTCPCGPSLSAEAYREPKHAGILRQCCPHPVASRVKFSPSLQDASLPRNNYPLLSQPLSALISDEELPYTSWRSGRPTS